MGASGVFTSPPDRIAREDVRVMLASTEDELPAIQRLWPWFEQLVGLKGRKFYGLAWPAANRYVACTPVKDGDDPAGYGLEVGVLPGGAYARGRLSGEPPGVYDLIGPGMSALESSVRTDTTRPLVEYYRSRVDIELWVPVS
jgi:hypothetical protein